MKRFKYLFFFFFLLLVTSNKTFAQDHAPVFAGGYSQSLVTCEGVSASINSLLAIIDSDTGDTENWGVVTAPSQGSLIASYTAVSNGGLLTPAGLSYTPGSGYSGPDSFTVSISDGFLSDTTTIYVTVNPAPDAGVISGAAGVCISGTTTLSDTAAGGVWSSSNTGVATINAASGTVTGSSGGAATISYSVTNGCGTAAATLPFTVNTAALPLPAAVTGFHAVCIGLVITLNDITTGGVWVSGNTAVATVDPVLGKVTGVSAGVAAISYTEINFCASYYSMITVSVDALPSAITGAVNLCMTTPVTLHDSIAGGMWSSSATGIATIGSVTGTVTGITPGTAIITYTAGVAGCKTTTLFTVNTTPAAFTITGGGAYCSGGTGNHIGLNGSAAGISYQLYRSSLPVGSPVAGTGAAIDFGLQTTAGAYTAIATDTLSGCAKNMTGTTEITINPLPTIYPVTGGGSYCTGGTGYHIYLVGSQASISYQLYDGAATSGTAVAGTGGALDYGIHTAAGIYTVQATNGSTGCTVAMSGSAAITVNSVPAVFAMIGGGSYCAGGTGIHIGLDSSGIGINYQLYNGAAALGAPAAGTGIPLDFGLITPAGIYTVVAINAATGCTSNMTGSVTVIIDPLPSAYTVTGSGSYCTGGTGLPVFLSGSDTGFNYQLYTGASAIGSTHTGTDSAIDFGLQTGAGIYTVVATNTVTGCHTSMAGSASVTIDSLPATFTVTGGGSYCAGGYGVYIDLNGSVADIDYQLYNDTALSGIPETGTGGPLDLGLETAPGTYTVVATDVATGCSNQMAGSAVVVENPVPDPITGVDSVAVGATITLSDATPGGTWSSNNTSLATVGPATGIVYGDTIGRDTITYTLATGCIATMEITVNYLPGDTIANTTIVGQMGNDARGIVAFPNPTAGHLYIKWNNQLTGIANVVITDAMGREVYTCRININAPSGQTQITPDLKDGIYLLLIRSESISYTGKLQVLR